MFICLGAVKYLLSQCKYVKICKYASVVFRYLSIKNELCIPQKVQCLVGYLQWDRCIGFYLFSCGGVIIATILNYFSVRYLRSSLLLQRSRQTHPKLKDKTSHTTETCFVTLAISTKCKCSKGKGKNFNLLPFFSLIKNELAIWSSVI